MRIVDDLLARIEAAATPLAERHAAEVAELDERIARYGGAAAAEDARGAPQASSGGTAPTNCSPTSP